MNKIKYRIFALLSATIIVSIIAMNFATINFKVDAQSPAVDASNIYETQTMTLGGNIKNLVILLPNEAHESPSLPEEQRLANQPYIPQNAVINKGTKVVWFNADVDHDHKITLVNGQDSATGTSNAIFESGDFPYNTASKPITFNNTGTFSYFETDVNTDDPNFVMNGTINVVNQPESLAATTTNETNALPTTTTIDTVGTLMVPTMDLATHTSDLENRGFSILSTYNFKDLRGGQEGTGDEQTLVLWGTSGAASMGDIISQLSEISSSLPYS